jgi:hypothetical protein
MPKLSCEICTEVSQHLSGPAALNSNEAIIGRGSLSGRKRAQQTPEDGLVDDARTIRRLPNHPKFPWKSFVLLLCFISFCYFTLGELKTGCQRYAQEAIERQDATWARIYDGYMKCPFDDPDCSQTTIKQLHTPAYEERFLIESESGFCRLLKHLPYRSLLPVASAAPHDLIISANDLKLVHSYAEDFKKQCDCRGWLWNNEANFAFQNTYHFVRTNLPGALIIQELQRPQKFYQLFGDSAAAWVQAQRNSLKMSFMVDQGFATQKEEKVVSAIVRFILVWHEAAEDGRATDSFGIAMIERAISTSSTGLCNCRSDVCLLTNLESVIGGRMKKDITEIAPEHWRAQIQY